MENLDYRVGFSIDPTAITQLQSLQAELEKISDLITRVNSSSVSPGTSMAGGISGGGGGGRGGGGYSSQSSRNAAASASGIGRQIQQAGGGYLSDIDPVPDYYPPELPTRDRGRGNRMDGQSSWNNWALVSGFNALAYGMEDMYYAGFRGMANNIPFMAQGLAAGLGFNPMTAMAAAGVGALGTTIGSMIYDNREGIFGEKALGSRENSIFGLPTKTESERYGKVASDAEFYVGRYGLGSDTGRYFSGVAGSNIARSQDMADLELSPERIAAILRTPSASQIRSASSLSVLDAPYGDFVQRKNEEFVNSRADEYYDRARQKAEENVPYFGSISNDRIIQSARDTAQADAARYTANLVNALSGNPEAIRALQAGVNDKSFTDQQREQMQSILNVGNNLSSYDRDTIQRLRAGSTNPYADMDYRQREIMGMLRNAGASDQTASDISSAIGDQMRSDQMNAKRPWQETVSSNANRWVGNIAATLGSIEVNSPYGQVRNAQAANMRSEIYNTLIQSGVPPAAAERQAEMLYQQGYEQYMYMVEANQGNANGFFNSLDQEQQMAFGQYQQNFSQIQMQRAAWMNQARMNRSRAGFPGAR